MKTATAAREPTPEQFVANAFAFVRGVIEEGRTLTGPEEQARPGVLQLVARIDRAKQIELAALYKIIGLKQAATHAAGFTAVAQAMDVQRGEAVAARAAKWRAMSPAARAVFMLGVEKGQQAEIVRALKRVFDLIADPSRTLTPPDSFEATW